MCQWTTDSRRLILEHFDMIYSSTSYIYCFALPISPPSSWLHQYYNADFSQDVGVVKGVSVGWGTCLRTVPLSGTPWALAFWKDTIAVGLDSDPIIIFSAITGVQVAILSGHIDLVTSLVFLPDGTSLVSGSNDRTIKLWDTQTGGVVMTFLGHTDSVGSVSISPDCTTIASGSWDKTIRLWDIQTGECHHTITQKDGLVNVCFIPLDPTHLMSVSGQQIWQSDTGGQQTVPLCDGKSITFSLDGTLFVICNETVVEVWSSDSKEVVTKFNMGNVLVGRCCFSPDNRVIAVAAVFTIYIWDITSSDPHLLETFSGHSGHVHSVAFSSPTSLISISFDKSVKFWQIGTSSTDPVLTDPGSISPAPAPIKSITLQTKDDGIAISSHSDGVVRIWDILTGLCKASFQTSAKNPHQMVTQLTNGRLISVWYRNKKIYIWDAKKGELLRTVDTSSSKIKDLRISGDGSKVFCLGERYIQAWSIWTGDIVGKVKVRQYLSPEPLLAIDGQKVWTRFHFMEPIMDFTALGPGSTMGWDFGALDSSPVELSNTSPVELPSTSPVELLSTSQSRPHLDFIGGIRTERRFLPGIQDTATGRVVFQLPVRLERPSDAQWDGQYLVAGYDSGEVLILKCSHIFH